MTDDRVLISLTRSINWIERNFGTYNSRRLDYRGGYGADSLPEHVSGSSEPALPGDLHFDKHGNLQRDVTQGRIDQEWREIKASLQRARTELQGVERMMAFLVNATKSPPDPEPRVCANQHCPDAHVFEMIGRDRPQDSTGRCDACRKYYVRNQRERTSFNAYRLGEDVA